jgi:hypothetical protein
MALIPTEKLPSVRRVQALGPEIENRLAKLRGACAAFDWQANATKAQQDLSSAKTESEIKDASTRLMALLSQEAAALKVVQAFANLEDQRRRAAWNDSARLLYAGFDEVERELTSLKESVEAEAAARSKKLGAAHTSREMLSAIEVRLQYIRTGRGHLDRNEAQEAKGHLSQAAEVVL